MITPTRRHGRRLAREESWLPGSRCRAFAAQLDRSADAGALSTDRRRQREAVHFDRQLRLPQVAAVSLGDHAHDFPALRAVHQAQWQPPAGRVGWPFCAAPASIHWRRCGGRHPALRLSDVSLAPGVCSALSLHRPLAACLAKGLRGSRMRIPARSRAAAGGDG